MWGYVGEVVETHTWCGGSVWGAGAGEGGLTIVLGKVAWEEIYLSTWPPARPADQLNLIS